MIDLLKRARQFIADSGCDEDDSDINVARNELLAEIDAANELEIQPRGGMTFDWQEQSLIYQKRLRALMKLIAKEGYAISSDGRTGMPYALSRFRDEPQTAWQTIDTVMKFKRCELRGIYADTDGDGLFSFKATHWRSEVTSDEAP